MSIVCLSSISNLRLTESLPHCLWVLRDLRVLGLDHLVVSDARSFLLASLESCGERERA